MRSKDKVIAEDKPTLEFLSQLREHRHRAGLRQKDLARLVGVKTATIMNYEHYHKQLKAQTLQRQKSRYGFSDLELERLTGYDAALVKRSMMLERTCSLPCLLAVIRVFEREKDVRG